MAERNDEPSAEELNREKDWNARSYDSNPGDDYSDLFHDRRGER